MVPHGSAELIALADAAAEAEFLGESSGWSVHRWQMTADHREKAVATYRAVVAASTSQPDEVLVELAASGVPVDELFFESTGSESARAQTVRGDLGELIGGALILKIEGGDLDHLYLQNVPKASLAKSETGLDIILVNLDPTSDATHLLDGEWFVLGSAKHTTHRLDSLRRDLVRSVTTEWSKPYLAQQLRVLHGLLLREGRHVKPSRCFLMLSEGVGGSCVGATAVGVVDSARLDDFVDQLGNLDQAVDDRFGFALIGLPQLDSIHVDCL